MSARGILAGVQWMYLGYFVLLNVIYLGLAFIALIGLRRHMRGASAAERVYSHLQVPVSMIVPAFNGRRRSRIQCAPCCSCATSISK
jgi:hypothetical protein